MAHHEYDFLSHGTGQRPRFILVKSFRHNERPEDPDIRCCDSPTHGLRFGLSPLITAAICRQAESEVVYAHLQETRQIMGLWCKYVRGAQQVRISSRDYAASTALQIAGTAWCLRWRLPKANCPLRIRCSSSIPAMVVAAQSKFLKPSIGPVRDLIPPVVLLDQIVQVFLGSQLGMLPSIVLPWHLAHCSV